MPRPSNRAVRRDQITRALMQVMAQKGFEGASISDVAGAAGLTAGLVHYHFDSKLEILIELIRSLTRQHLGAIDEVIRAADDATSALEALITYTLARGRDKDRDALFCWIDLAGEALQKEAVRVEYERALHEVHDRIRSIVERGIAEKRFHVEDPNAAAAALLALIQGYFVVAGTARRLIPSGSAAPSALAMMHRLLEPPA